jgi:hypothetical protein
MQLRKSLVLQTPMSKKNLNSNIKNQLRTTHLKEHPEYMVYLRRRHASATSTNQTSIFSHPPAGTSFGLEVDKLFEGLISPFPVMHDVFSQRFASRAKLRGISRYITM